MSDSQEHYEDLAQDDAPNAVIAELAHIARTASKTHIVHGATTYTLDDPALPAHVVANFVKTRMRRFAKARGSAS